MPNIGVDDPDGFDSLIADAVARGIQFSYIGVGVDFAQDFVAHLSSHPGSNYFFINDARQLQQRLIEEFDYNFFPMVYDVELRVDEPSMIDEIYGVDELRDGRVLSIDTLFPSPPRDG